MLKEDIERKLDRRGGSCRGRRTPRSRPAACRGAGAGSTSRRRTPRRRWVAPVETYQLSAGFGSGGDRWANRHTGQDFAVPIGTPVRAVGAGRVVRVSCGGAFGIEVVHPARGRLLHAVRPPRRRHRRPGRAGGHRAVDRPVGHDRQLHRPASALRGAGHAGDGIRGGSRAVAGGTRRPARMTKPAGAGAARSVRRRPSPPASARSRPPPRRRCWRPCAPRPRRARPGGRCPSRTTVPAQVSISTSFGMSPKATTSSCEIPRSAQHRASVLALETPGPLISSRALGLERVTLARSPMASRASVRKASGSRSGW